MNALSDSALAAPGRILLISGYELGHAPMGLALPAGLLRRAGYEPALLDLSAGRLDEEQARHATFIGISAPMHTALRLGQAAARRIRRLNPGAHICYYGLYAGLHASLLLEGEADAVIGGEYGPVLLDWVRALERNRGEAVPGVSTPGDLHPPRIARSDYNLPDRSGLPPLSAYAQVGTGTPGEALRTAGYTEASQGCKHLCLHCPFPPAYQGRFFAVPVEQVLDDVAQQMGQGATHITFGDPDFLNGPTHARRVAEALHTRFPQVSYDITAKVEHLLRHAELLPLLARTGCLFIVTAAESMSDTVLAHLDKGHTRADIEQAAALVRRAGIALRPTWVPFTPWSTVADTLALLGFVREQGLVNHVDSVQYAIRLLVPPGSALLDTPQFAPHQQPLDREALLHPWRHPDPRMDALQAQVAEIVERDAATGATAETTFQTVYRATLATAGENSAPPPLPPQPPAPRLTEPWFC